MQVVTPTPTPGGDGGGSIDLTGLANAIGDAFKGILNAWGMQLPDQAATNGTTLLHTFWTWMGLQGINFIATTPLTIVTAAGAAFGVNSARPLLEAVVTIAVLLGAIGVAGHHWLGWPGIDETAGRIITTVILVGSCFRLMIFSIDTLNSMVAGVLHAMPPLPNMDSAGSPMMTFALLLLWLILAIRLGIVMGKRMVWIAVLYVLAPVALATWVHEKSAWIASTWAKLWVGWLVGQLIVVLVLLVATTFVNFGGPAGYLLSVAALLVAYDAVHILAPSNGGLTISLGVGPARIKF